MQLWSLSVFWILCPLCDDSVILWIWTCSLGWLFQESSEHCSWKLCAQLQSSTRHIRLVTCWSVCSVKFLAWCLLLWISGCAFGSWLCLMFVVGSSLVSSQTLLLAVPEALHSRLRWMPGCSHFFVYFQPLNVGPQHGLLQYELIFNLRGSYHIGLLNKRGI